MTDLEKQKPIPGKLVVFLIGKTGSNLETTAVVESRPARSAPSYLDVIPKQKVIKVEKRKSDGVEVGFVVKAYLPDIVVVEATLEREDILSRPRSTLSGRLPENAEGFSANSAAIPSSTRIIRSIASPGTAATLKYTFPCTGTGSRRF